MDKELEKEELTRAPDTLLYTNDASDDTDHEDHEEERPLNMMMLWITSTKYKYPILVIQSYLTS